MALGSGIYTTSTWTLVKIIYDSATPQIKVNVGGTDVITYDDSDIPWGFVALSGWQAKFQDLKVGYDSNADDELLDPGDDVVIADRFDGTSVSPTYDDNGNLTKDADYVYTCDAPALDSPPGLRPAMLCMGRVASAACQGCEQPGQGRRSERQQHRGGPIGVLRRQPTGYDHGHQPRRPGRDHVLYLRWLPSHPGVGRLGVGLPNGGEQDDGLRLRPELHRRARADHGLEWHVPHVSGRTLERRRPDHAGWRLGRRVQLHPLGPDGAQASPRLRRRRCRR